MTSAQTVLDIARGEIGYNRYDDPDTGSKYGRWYAAATNSPWFASNGVAFCNMFTTWVLAKAGVSEPGAGYFAYVPYTIDAYTNVGRRVWDKYDAQPGDLVCFDWDGDGGADHIGIVEANQGDWLQTIEGNTSSGTWGSQANGGGVYRRARSFDGVCAILRPNYNNTTTTSTRPVAKPDRVQKGNRTMIFIAIADYAKGHYEKDSGYLYGILGTQFFLRFSGTSTANNFAKQLGPAVVVSPAFWDDCAAAAMHSANNKGYLGDIHHIADAVAGGVAGK